MNSRLQSRGTINHSAQDVDQFQESESSKVTKSRENTPQVHMQLNKKRDNSPIYVQINNDDLSNSNLSPALNERSPTLKYTRAALLKLKESIDYKSNESMNYRNNQFNIEKSIDAQEMKGSHLSRQKKNTINLSKLSMVLKNRGAIGAS